MMEQLPGVNASKYGEIGSLHEVCNGLASETTETLNGLAEGGHNSDLVQTKGGNYVEIPISKISELINYGSFKTASIPATFSIINRMIDNCIEQKNDDIPKGVASILKLLILELQQQVSKQSQKMKKQSALYTFREERCLEKIRVLETLVSGTTEENEVVLNQLQQSKFQESKSKEEKELIEQGLITLKQEKDHCESVISSLEEEVKLAKKAYEENCSRLEVRAEETENKLQKKILELEYLLSDSRNKVKELEEFSESKFMLWKRKEHVYKHFIDSQTGSLQSLRLSTESIKQEVSNIKYKYAEEFHRFGLNLKGLIDAAQDYHTVLEENRKLYNEVQDLKGNIRVYCRIRPFLPGQSRKQTTIQYMGENGELVVVNPSKPGKDSHRLFKFNKVFGPAATQEEVFRDTQPLIRSVLDGYNVCIFAYGQTGSGKTYTMSGPSVSSVVDWGVNYRALDDLFNISQTRSGSIEYEVGVQMVEIYNEQVRDLLCNDNFQKRLGIWSTSQPNGLAVPDASMHPVKSTADVLELMNVGLMNRAVGATALNERSSRSHSILTVHVRGLDLETNAVLRGCLHLVDLAGSERVDRSEATGDRLREAQHINRSLSALGDVIFALAQKNPHVPYRNSKLTQVLQSSLGGQAKTLMFVQLNPDVESYFETISTLKFAERVSGVELGAARSNKEGRDVRELMEQVASLKDAVAKKDEEMRRIKWLEKIDSASPISYSTIGPNIYSGVENSCDPDNDKHSDADDFKLRQDLFQQTGTACADGAENFLGDADFEKLSETSDSLSTGIESEGPTNSIARPGRFSEIARPSTEKRNARAELPRPQVKQGQTPLPRLSLHKSSTKVPTSKRASLSSFSAMAKIPSRR
ncbi:kinesin-like protein KIN-14J [Andrographis paniculata]|uniref:kinesin-like protein KIN-14J n=1 Tax=Andrographis paniculata TaxID=175694 RepID=UPI0021E914F8|nr:kinesin-like protein KIN-14J [Andrographis paniculata]XP_051129965.1 kinesin-like protein KIN-14J [Andrographis paniculata]